VSGPPKGAWFRMARIIRLGQLRVHFVARLVHEKTFVRREDYDALVAAVDHAPTDSVAGYR
jgi:hypothetical protein